MTERPPGRPDAATLEAAAAWYLDLQGAAPDAPVRRDHARWLELDPRHRNAWERVERLRQAFDHLPDTVGRDTFHSARAARRQMLKKLTVLLMAGGTAALAMNKEDGLRALAAGHRTGTGERRRIALADGGQVELNTGTALDLRYGAERREIRLYGGEILVRTGSDPAGRPFIVSTRHGTIRALGTRFLVRSEDDSTLVQVLEHAVEVHPHEAADLPLRIDAGRQVRFGAGASDAVQPLEGRPDAWAAGMLVADGWRLDRLVAELSRHHRGYLGCDPAVAHLTLSGVFHLDDIPGILENLGAMLPIQIRHRTRYWAYVEARGRQ